MDNVNTQQGAFTHSGGGQGLTTKEAQNRLSLYGENVLKQKKKKPPVIIFLRQFKDALVIILLIALTLSAAMGQVHEALTILAIVFCNGVLGFIQEYRTEKTIDALGKLVSPTCRVRRDGEIVKIPVEKLVPGDVMMLADGDRVGADGIIIKCTEINCDESMLTGESMPVEKRMAHDGTDGDEGCILRKGTVIVYGHGEAEVIATGMETKMGKIAGMLSSVKEESSPLQDRMSTMGKQIGIGCIVICAVVAAMGMMRGYPPMEMVLTAISLAVAAVPEGLPAIVTIALALAMGRLSKKRALIRTLPAVETLGCATVICTDKTGTITQNLMRVTHVSNGFESISSDKNSTEVPWVREGVGTAVLCCSTAENRGNPTEKGILEYGEELGLTQDLLEKSYRRVGETPFSSKTKFMQVTVENSRGKLIIRKGAPNVILGMCKMIMRDGIATAMSREDTDRIMIACDEMASTGLRVIGVCAGVDDEHQIFKVWIGLSDPIKPGVRGAVKKCRRSGVEIKMITGDHRLTATCVARQAGIYSDGDMVLTGAQMDELTGDELESMVARAKVFARVSPQHKLQIVRILKKQGQIVAMTGDGVNDAPAVKEANMGVTMGIAGTEVTKEAGDLMLTDDDFSTIVDAVEEGRVVYSNIRKFIRYLLSCNLGEVATVFVAMMMGMPVVLLPIQLLMINLVTDGLPALALGVEPGDDDVMTSPPRNPRATVFSGGLLTTICFRGVLIGMCTLGTFVSCYKLGGIDAGRTGAFLTLMFTQLIHVFECKSERVPIHMVKFSNNFRLVLAVISSAIIGLAGVVIPQMRAVFGFVLLDAQQIMQVVGWTLVGPILSEVFFALRKNKNKKKNDSALNNQTNKKTQE